MTNSDSPALYIVRIPFGYRVDLQVSGYTKEDLDKMIKRLYRQGFIKEIHPNVFEGIEEQTP